MEKRHVCMSSLLSSCTEIPRYAVNNHDDDNQDVTFKSVLTIDSAHVTLTDI